MRQRIVDYVEASIGKYPDNIAYEFMGNRVSYKTLGRQIDSAAKALTSLGVRENDIICIAMPNMPQAVVLIYAANKIGAVVNMIHPLSSENEILFFVNRVHAKTILVLDQFYEGVRHIRAQTELQNIIVASAGEALGSLKRIAYRMTQGKKLPAVAPEAGVLRWNDFMRLSTKVQTLPALSDDGEDMAFILHSGGTTGKVKGVCLSNYSIINSAQQMIKANPMLAPADRFLTIMPIFHGNGLIIGVHTMLVLGAHCVLIPRFTPDSYAKDLIKHRCNYTSGVPALFERLLDVKAMQSADLSFLKGVFCGADYLSVELERRIDDFLTAHHSPVPVRQGYGMTEGVVATALVPWDAHKEGSIGKPLPGVSVKIVEPGTDRELPCGEVGEIVFSSATNMMYYYDEPEETALVMRRHSDGLVWIHSGDLGTADSDGYLYFKGRIKRMIVTNGYNVFPNELESVIDKFDMVERSCVVGVPYTEGTQRIKAFIVLKKGWSPTQETRQLILEQCRKGIAKYALPKEIEFISELPKTKVGKIDYKALK